MREELVESEEIHKALYDNSRNGTVSERDTTLDKREREEGQTGGRIGKFRVRFSLKEILLNRQEGCQKIP